MSNGNLRIWKIRKVSVDFLYVHMISLKVASWRFVKQLFTGCLSTTHRIYTQILNSNAGDFQLLVKLHAFNENLGLISLSLQHDDGGFTCMLNLSQFM